MTVVAARQVAVKDLQDWLMCQTFSGFLDWVSIKSQLLQLSGPSKHFFPLKVG